MRKLKLTSVTLIILAVIVAILLNNKSQMAANSRPDVASTIAVNVAAVTSESIERKASFVGTVNANNDVAIVSETDGKVMKVMVETGDKVRAGQVLLQIDDELKHAAYATAEVNYEKAKRDLARYEALAGDSAISASQIEGARLAFKAAEAEYIVARRQYNDTRITSPISGVVTERLADIGDRVDAGDKVANVVDVSRLKVKLSVAENEAFRLKPGDEVTVVTEVYPGVTFTGTVATISDKGDAAHTYPVEVDLANSEKHPLKAGMFARVNFNTLPAGGTLTIPREALVGSARQPQVFVVENNVSKLRDIVIGEEIGTRVPVLSGLSAGERIVVNGQTNLHHDMTVTVIDEQASL